MVLGILEKRWKLLATRNLSSQFWCVSAADSCRHSERPVENPHPLEATLTRSLTHGSSVWHCARLDRVRLVACVRPAKLLLF